MQTKLLSSPGATRPRSSISIQTQTCLVQGTVKSHASVNKFCQAFSAHRRRSLSSVITCAAAATDAPVQAQGFARGEQWSLHKFGGTCVSAAERIFQAGEVLVQV